MKFTGSFGNWLRLRRKALDLTQAEFAHQISCSIIMIQKIEADARRPSKQITERMADVLAISMDDRVAFLAFARKIGADSPAPELMSAIPRHNLPQQPTLFVGRSDELAQISKRMDTPDCRLLTLVGAGGVGKTRLALQAASEMIRHFADGVFFVSLAPLSQSDVLAATLASALNISFYDATDPKAQIINFLREKHILLVMDNFEHLLDATGLLTDILEAAPSVKILVTSRERLNLQVEWVIPVPGLPFPGEGDIERVEDYAAVQLFLQSAHRTQPNFSLKENVVAVIAICQFVEGLPLAIELATTWLRLMPCHQIAAHIEHNLDFLATPLRDVPARHQSLRAVFEQSWQLLSAAEQIALMALSIFRGGFDLDAAEQIAAASLPILASLSDKSLIRVLPSGRYDLHELLRQYANIKLDESGEAEAVASRHLSFFFSQAEQAEPELYKADQVAWLDHLEADHDNFRAALEWALTTEVTEVGLGLAANLGMFWSLRGHLGEGRYWLEKTLATSKASESSTRAKALYMLGWLIRVARTERSKAKALCEEALRLFQKTGNMWGVASTLSLRAFLAFREGDYDHGVGLANESLAIFKELGDVMGMGSANYVLAAIAEGQGDNKRAWAQHLESLTYYRKLGNKERIAHQLALLGNITQFDGKEAQARPLYEEALALAQEVRSQITTAWVLDGLARLALLEGHYDEAEALFAQCLNLCRSLGGRTETNRYLRGLGYLAYARGNYRQAAIYLRQAVIICQETEDIFALMVCLSGLAQVALAEGKAVWAGHLFGAVEAQVKKPNGYSLWGAERADYDSTVTAAREKLSDPIFAAAWAEGASMTLEQAVAYVLGQENPATGGKELA